jgi:hypothetical protein
MMLSMGCLNPFSDCYSGRTLSELRREGLLVDEPNPSPELVFVTDLTVSQREWFELGWMPLGYASWIGDRTGSKSQARAQASQIGASVVLVQAPQGVYTHSGNKASTPVPMVKSVFLYRPVQAPTLGVLGDTQAFARNFGSRDALGLLVDVVIRGSPADVMGMRSGDVLVRVGEYEVKGPDSQLEVLER